MKVFSFRDPSFGLICPNAHMDIMDEGGLP